MYKVNKITRTILFTILINQATPAQAFGWNDISGFISKYKTPIIITAATSIGLVALIRWFLSNPTKTSPESSSSSSSSASSSSSSSSSSRQAPEKTARWLIFGANENNKEVLDNAFSQTHVAWYGFDEVCQGSKFFIKGNFNELKDLESLTDNFYDVIYFDQSTAKFLEWTNQHLEILKRKLKNPGLLLIPIDTPGGLSKPIEIYITRHHMDTHLIVNPEGNNLRNEIKKIKKDLCNIEVFPMLKLISTSIPKINVDKINTYVTEMATMMLNLYFDHAIPLTLHPKHYPPTSRENNNPNFYICLNSIQDISTIYNQLVYPVTQIKLEYTTEFNQQDKTISETLQNIITNSTAYVRSDVTHGIKKALTIALDLLAKPGQLTQKIDYLNMIFTDWGYMKPAQELNRAIQTYLQSPSSKNPDRLSGDSESPSSSSQ